MYTGSEIDFEKALNACKNTLDFCKSELIKMYEKGNKKLNITFSFNPGEVVFMTINSEYIVKETCNYEINIKEKEGKNNESNFNYKSR